MSDELDQDLLRRFARANAPLPDAEFHARVMEELHRNRGWRDIPHFVGSALTGIWSGFSAGVTAPLRLRMGTGLFAIVVGAIVSGLALLSA
jgi:hypothetical protein